MKHLILISIMLLSFAGFSQNLDRIAISSGGISSDTLNATIGEIFVFSISSGGISLDAGSQSDTTNSGGITTTIEALRGAVTLVFPNPVSDFVNMKIADANDDPLVFSVFDATGRLVMQQNAAAVNHIYTIGVSQLVAGQYFLSGMASSGKQFGNIQFVKQ